MTHQYYDRNKEDKPQACRSPGCHRPVLAAVQGRIWPWVMQAGRPGAEAAGLTTQQPDMLHVLRHERPSGAAVKSLGSRLLPIGLQTEAALEAITDASRACNK